MSQEPKAGPLPPLEAGDFYFEGTRMVFTGQYLLKRGKCCESGCRHCPYGFVGGAAAPGEVAAGEETGGG